MTVDCCMSWMNVFFYYPLIITQPIFHACSSLFCNRHNNKPFGNAREPFGNAREKLGEQHPVGWMTDWDGCTIWDEYN